MKGSVLIVDESRDVLKALEEIVRQESEKVYKLTNPTLLIDTLKRNEPDIIMLNMNFRSGVHNGNEGLYWVREIFKYDSNLSMVIVTDSADIILAVRAIREGAVDYISKPRFMREINENVFHSIDFVIRHGKHRKIQLAFHPLL